MRLGNRREGGAFFSLPAPPVISVLEYVHIGVLLVTLLLAWTVSRDREGGSLAREA